MATVATEVVEAPTLAEAEEASTMVEGEACRGQEVRSRFICIFIIMERGQSEFGQVLLAKIVLLLLHCPNLF